MCRLGLCVTACPQYPNSAVRVIPATKKAIKCDLCGGDPQCVKFCPKSVALTPHLYPEKDRVLKFVKGAAVIGGMITMADTSYGWVGKILSWT